MKRHQIEPSNTDRLWHGALFIVAFFCAWTICFSVTSVSVHAIAHFMGYQLSPRGIVDVGVITMSALVSAFVLRTYWQPDPREIYQDDQPTDSSPSPT